MTLEVVYIAPGCCTVIALAGPRLGGVICMRLRVSDASRCRKIVERS